MEEKLDEGDCDKVTRLSYAAAEKTRTDFKQRHVRKLEKLLSRSKKTELGTEGQACCLSKRILTPSQEEIFKKGLNFAPIPTSFPLQDTIAGMEEAAWSFQKMMPRTYRCVFAGSLGVLSFPKTTLRGWL